jgi:hypothetical protein
MLDKGKVKVRRRGEKRKNREEEDYEDESHRGLKGQ